MQKNHQSIEIDIDTILEGYKKLFTEENLTKTELTKTKRTLDQLENDSQNIKVEFNKTKLDELIKNLQNGKSTGMSGISNEMQKYARNDQTENKLVEVLAILFDKIFEYQIVPTNFNLNIIKPIIKDLKQATNTLKNLRAVTIADAIPNVFQNIILEIINVTHIAHPKQFGF